MERFELYHGTAGYRLVSALGMCADVVVHLCDDIQKKITRYFLAVSFVLFHSFSHCNDGAYVAQEHAKIPGSWEHN